VFPQTHDKDGRPIVIFRAAKHSPSHPFISTLKVIVYLMERAAEQMAGISPLIYVCLYTFKQLMYLGVHYLIVCVSMNMRTLFLCVFPALILASLF